jgi:ATP-dependent RNA helicase DeaD
VTKDDIGKIQILVRETRVEIRADASERFATAARRPDRKEPHIRIQRVPPPRT